MIEEALSAATRRKLGRSARKNKSKIKRGRERAKRKKASTEVLKKRAKASARKEMFKKLSKGKSPNELSFSQRGAIEKKVAGKKTQVEVLAKKILPKLRKKEQSK